MNAGNYQKRFRLFKNAKMKSASSVVVSLLLVAGSFAIALEAVASAATREEVVVRDTYGKASFATRIGVVVHSAVLHSEGWPEIDDEAALRRELDRELKFEHSHFVVGKLSDIASNQWLSYVTSSPVPVIQLTYEDLPVTLTTDEKTTTKKVVFAYAWWAKDTGPPKRRSYLTVGQAIKSVRAPVSGEWERFASFRVRASLRGRSITYKALFLFAQDEQGNETVLPIDTMINPSALAQFVENPMYPSALVETTYREIPFVRDWIKRNELKNCKRGPDPQVCCNFRSNQCGIASEDLAASFSQPVDPQTKWIIDQKGQKEKQ